MRLLSLLARDVLRAMFVSASVFRATTSSSRAAKFRAAILDVAGDLDDLKHITEPDFEELVRGMPKLKARRLRASLVELGARLA